MRATPGPIPVWAVVVGAVLIAVGIAFGAVPLQHQLDHPDTVPHCINQLGFVCD